MADPFIKHYYEILKEIESDIEEFDRDQILEVWSRPIITNYTLSYSNPVKKSEIPEGVSLDYMTLTELKEHLEEQLRKSKE